MALHINIEDLLSSKTVESDRIEYKEGWNPDSTYRSICAFANDFDNTGGGYILIGVTENPKTKIAHRPVKGLTSKEIAEIQQDMIGFNNLIKPYYAPRLSIEIVDQQQIIVLWVIAGGERPYEVPETITAKHKTWKYFIRKYASSIEAKGTDKEELIALANNIPFDDRANTQASIANVSMFLVQEHLRKIGSKLVDDIGRLTSVEILQQMALLTGPTEQLFPRNVALMLFTEKPHTYFPYTWVEIVYFPKGASDKEFIEKIIDGPVQQQISDSLNWLRNNILQEMVIKVPGQAEALRAWNYPYPALEEAIANCLYHRNYQEREPVTIRIEPDSILLYNSGGPDRSIKREDFVTGKAIPKRYRNRRLGDFLKELKLTEGHATGLPALKKAMKLNNSPEPVFDFDEERTWFQVLMPINPNFVQKQLMLLDLKKVIWDISGIDRLLKEILEKADIPQTRGKAGGIAESVENTDILVNDSPKAEAMKSAEIQLYKTIGDISGGKAGGKAGAEAESMEIIDIQLDETIGYIAGDLVGGKVGGKAGGKAGDIAGDIAEFILVADSQVFEVIGQIDRDVVRDIAEDIAESIDYKLQEVLSMAKEPINRISILRDLNLSIRAKNFETYILPLVSLNWLTMIIPHKPTSPKQKYLTTLKGRLILEFLKHKTK
jgi:ATP-dependent DNA helicase RecG